MHSADHELSCIVMQIRCTTIDGDGYVKSAYEYNTHYNSVKINMT